MNKCVFQNISQVPYIYIWRANNYSSPTPLRIHAPTPSPIPDPLQRMSIFYPVAALKKSTRVKRLKLHFSMFKQFKSRVKMADATITEETKWLVQTKPFSVLLKTATYSRKANNKTDLIHASRHITSTQAVKRRQQKSQKGNEWHRLQSQRTLN